MNQNKLYNSSKRLRQFTSHRDPKPSDKIVYVSGSFDILHKGHIEFLEKAKKLGTYLILGLHNDATVNHYKGDGFPILNEQERMLNMLANRYVDEVILGAPWKVSEHMINLLKIDVVAESNKKR